MNALLRISMVFAAAGMVSCQSGKDPEAQTMTSVTTKPSASALLQDVSMLKPSPLHSGTWYELSSSLKNYNAMIIDEPVVSPNAFGKAPIEDGVSAELAGRLKDELANALGQDFSITQQPGPKTVRLQVLIRRIDRSRERGTGTRIIGGAAADLRIIDSTSGNVLMAASEDDRAADTHAMTSSDPYHDAKATFVHWSARTARALRSIDELATRP